MSDEGEESKQGEGMPPLEHLHLHLLEGGAGGGRVKEKSSAAAEAREVQISNLLLLTLLALLRFTVSFRLRAVLVDTNSENILKCTNMKYMLSY